MRNLANTDRIRTVGMQNRSGGIRSTRNSFVFDFDWLRG
jgi:hypothetical protein